MVTNLISVPVSPVKDSEDLFEMGYADFVQKLNEFPVLSEPVSTIFTQQVNSIKSPDDLNNLLCFFELDCASPKSVIEIFNAKVAIAFQKLSFSSFSSLFEEVRNFRFFCPFVSFSLSSVSALFLSINVFQGRTCHL